MTAVRGDLTHGAYPIATRREKGKVLTDMPHKPGILLVDANPDDVAMIRAALERAFIGYPLDVVCDGQEAIEYLTGAGVYADRTTHPLPRVMLLDLRMPRLDGFAVLRWVRQSPEFANLCV